MSVITGDDGEMARAANQAIAEAQRCVLRPDGKKTHVFLDGGNRCECGDVDLHAYREAGR